MGVEGEIPGEGTFIPLAMNAHEWNRRRTVGDCLVMRDALRSHWPEYLMEAGGLGLFMVAACVVAVLIGHPMSPLGPWLGSDLRRRIVAGIAMGLVSIALTTSPWGKRSGGH